ncbi:MAG: glycosyltransferase family 4 protein [Acidobacteriaceae bacterium]|nr:glycosyltransferase family 4 protein [Acidobacteriaceae bacterium]
MRDRWPVLIMVRSLDEGGCERDAAKLAIGLDRDRFEPHVGVFYAAGFRTPELEAAGVPIVELPVRSLRNASAIEGARRMRAYIRQHDIRLIHSLDIPLSLFAAPVARLNHVPVVITSQLSYRNMYPRWQQAVLRVTDHLSTRVVINSRAVGKSLERDLGFPSHKLFLCYNGVNPAEFFPGEGLRPPSLRDARVIVGCVCVMRKEKRIDWIMRAFARLHALYPHAGLLLVGSGTEVAPLTSLRDQLGLQNACHFEPGHPNVAGWMRGIDVFVASSYSESFPNALLEAMACGCCAIGSNVGGIPELVTHGHDGLIFDTDSPDHLFEMMYKAVTDADLRNTLRKQAVITAHQRFSMRNTLQRMEGLYENLLEERGCHRLEGSAAVC